jgi:hypothetical protein
MPFAVVNFQRPSHLVPVLLLGILSPSLTGKYFACSEALSRLSEVAIMNAPETNFPLDALEIDKTDKTYFVRNNEFLQAVFGNKATCVCPVVVSFEGNPASVPPKVWSGRPWQGTPDLAESLSASAEDTSSTGKPLPELKRPIRSDRARVGFGYTVQFVLTPDYRLDFTWTPQVPRGRDLERIIKNGAYRRLRNQFFEDISKSLGITIFVVEA